jgi:predicted transposase
MNRTIRLVLQPTKEQAESLKLTIEQFTACLNKICEFGWHSNQRNGVKLHHATYKSLKSSFSIDLPMPAV